MAEPKTKLNTSSPLAFIKSIPDTQQREDSLTLLDMFKEATGQEPKMWGTSIIGFGVYKTKSEKVSQQNDWPLVAFSPRKQNLTLYIITSDPDSNTFPELLSKLGKHKVSKACLYINKLSDIDTKVLRQLIKKSYSANKKKYNS